MPEATNKNLEKLTKLLAVVDEKTLTRDEFLSSFREVVTFVLAIQKKQEQAINSLEQTYANLLRVVSQKHDMSLSELKGQVDSVFVGNRVKKMEDDYGSRSKTMEEKMASMESVHKEMMSMIEDKMSKVKDGKDGRDGMPAQKPTKQEIESVLKPLVDEATKTLKKEFSEKLSRIPRGGSRGKVPIFQATDFTSSVDGATTTFTLPRDTVRVFGVFSTQFPGVFNTTDWSFAGQTLTLNFTLQSGQSLVVFHENLFYS